LAAFVALAACGDDVPTPLVDPGEPYDEAPLPDPPPEEPVRSDVVEVPIQVIGDLQFEEIAGGLMNPSGLSVGPDGALYICDSGNGRIVRLRPGIPSEHIVGFDTEFWKVDPKSGTKRFKLGPLSILAMADGSFYVTDGGKPDGKETLLHFTGPSLASAGKPSNPVGPTSDDPADQGEGNLTGMSLSPDGRTIYVAGQGSDAKSWVLRYDIGSNKLEPWASADENGITVNSPMQTLVWDAKTVLVLYSGEGGKDDGLIVAWDVDTAKPRAQWRLPGMVDPMGFARIPGTADLIVVDNNWALEKVQYGFAARVTLPKESGEVSHQKLITGLRGPTTCTFDKDGTLYIAQLGEEYDGRSGNVLKVTGIK
jgi:sugar lactone lactonase YvrE